MHERVVAGVMWRDLGGLYIVIFGFVTVGTALLRRAVLKKSPTKLQWLAVVIITGGLCASATTLFETTLTIKTVLGVASSLVAATCDALLYVMAERALSTDDGPTANEITYAF